MKPEFPICAKTGKVFDFGPFTVSVESRDANFSHEFNDLPSEARFPYAYDRASRYAVQMQQEFPGADISITGPDGKATTFPPYV